MVDLADDSVIVNREAGILPRAAFIAKLQAYSGCHRLEDPHTRACLPRAAGAGIEAELDMGAAMLALSFKFNILRVTVGGLGMSAGPSLFVFDPGLRIAAVVIFGLGVLLAITGLVALSPRRAIVHVRWSQERLRKAMRQAPETATVDLLQTWIPEEDFIDGLRHLYLNDGKRFHLRVLLMNPAEKGLNDVLAARIKLRGIERSKAANDIAHTRDSLLRLKRDIDRKLAELARAGQGRAETMDLEIRLYDFMPFGPIYKIGEQVMFIGLYLNDASSIFGPMIEIRKSRSPELWRDIERSLSSGWEASPTYVPPAGEKELTHG
jgi:hypothetical protein